jgi:predicted Rossmann fold flavoprotein
VIHKYDVLIVGGGAAGLMCAITAGRRGRRVALLEHAERVGKKILISGGGRCNFTNLHCRPENFLSANPHFCKSALARYTPQDFIALVEKHRIPYHEKTLGQLFCDGSAREIVALLEEECRAAHVDIFTAARVREVIRTDVFVAHAGEDEFHAPTLVVATGGLSIPKMGATVFGYELARKFGLRVRECRPALVPLTFAAADSQHYCDLAGVSAEVVASIGPQHFREKMLITHRGLSGPAILQISSYWDGKSPVAIDLAPETDVTQAIRQEPSGRSLETTKSAFRAFLAERLADRWVELHAPSRWTNAALEELESTAHASPANWAASTSSGPGRQGSPPAKPSSQRGFFRIPQ